MMKSFFFSVLMTGFCLTFLNAQNFEGIITMTSTEKIDMELVFTVKGKQVLITADTEDGKVWTYSNTASETVTTLFEREGKKFGLKMGPETMKMIDQEISGLQNEPDKKWDITVTKETKKIDGYECTKVIGKDDKNEVEGWITQDLGFTIFDLMPAMLEKAISEDGENGVQQEIMRKGFLLEGHQTDLETGEKNSIKLTVKKQKIEDSKFDFSSDYKIYDMTDMMSMMMELQQDPEKMKEFEELMKLIQN